MTPQLCTINTVGLSFNSIRDELYLFIMFISLGIICQIVSVFGTITNIINIIVFVKQGFTESINVCLLALAVSDLLSLLFIIWSNLCFTPAFRDADIPLVTYEVQRPTGSWPHVVFTRITGWITAFISFQRCVCVLLPLKVKTVFTPFRHAVIMASIFIVTLGCSSLLYVTMGLGYVYFPEKNISLISIVYHLDANSRQITDSVGYAVNGVFMPVVCFLSVVLCTCLLIVKLNQQAVWRNANSSGTGPTDQPSKNNVTVNSKERKIAKMVVLISSIFIASFLPAVGTFITAYVAEPQLSYDGRHRNLLLVAFAVSFTAEAINSSINIFVYLAMSTKYRKTFQDVFHVRLVQCCIPQRKEI